VLDGLKIWVSYRLPMAPGASRPCRWDENPFSSHSCEKGFSHERNTPRAHARVFGVAWHPALMLVFVQGMRSVRVLVVFVRVTLMFDANHIE